MKKALSWIPRRGLPILLLVALLCLLVYSVYLRMNATAIGGSFGQGLGELTGLAIGSFEGMTTGREEGKDAGRTAGLSADDTEVDIANEIRQVSNLQVLVASVKINDVHSIGKEVDYSALYLLKGEVIFSVDLSEAVIDSQGTDMLITIPQPTGQLVIDQSQMEKVAEYQKHYFKGDAEAGFDAFLNSMTKVQEATTETLDNYDVLLESAKESAIKQVTQLATSASTHKRNVTIRFSEGDQAE